MKMKIKYWNQNIPFKKLIKTTIMQKLVGFNRKIPWPVHWTTLIKSHEKIVPGSRCPGLSPGCYLDGRNGIVIGDNVWIGPSVSLISMNHDLITFQKYINNPPIIIGDNCWLGASTIILPGVKLGNHVVIGAGSIVTRSFEDNDILIAGNPAKKIKNLDKYSLK